MQHLLKATILIGTIVAAAPAFAGGFEFESTLKQPINVAVALDVELGEDLAYRADHLPRKMKDRSNGRQNAAFANNGFYGEKELDKLEDKLESKLEKAFEKNGLTVADDAALVLKVVIVDAKPNRPTFAQMSKESGLSHQSFALGGAAIEGELQDADGNIVATMAYKFYENDIEQAQYGGTWSDANKAFARFAKKAANKLSISE